MDINELAAKAKEYHKVKTELAEIEKVKKELETFLKSYMNEIHEDRLVVDEYCIEITHRSATRIADTEALKKAGLFDQYSKEKAGYDALSVTKK